MILHRFVHESTVRISQSIINTGKVKEFCDGLVAASLPTEMTVGGHTYDILGFLRGDEKFVPGSTMVARAKEMNANLGKDDREHLIAYQDEIPAVLCGKVAFVFTDDRHPDRPGNVFDVDWRGGRWVTLWRWLVLDWRGHGRVLRRKSA